MQDPAYHTHEYHMSIRMSIQDNIVFVNAIVWQSSV